MENAAYRYPESDTENFKWLKPIKPIFAAFVIVPHAIDYLKKGTERILIINLLSGIFLVA